MPVNTEKSSQYRASIDDQNYKAHAENGIHFLSGTDAAPDGIYYGFLVTGDVTTIDSITYIDATKQTGDITTITLQPGAYIPTPGGFSTITLTAGNMILLRKDTV